MPTIVVDVMPKSELLDPQGKAVAGALARTGRGEFTAVRVGKRFELTVDGPIDDDLKSRVRQIAEEFLSNSVIEDVVGVHYEVAHAEVVDGEAGDGSESAAASGFDAPAGETH